MQIADNHGPLLPSAAPPPGGEPGEPLTREQLDMALPAAQAERKAAGPDADFSGVTATVAGLDGPMLGHADARAVVVDTTAATVRSFPAMDGSGSASPAPARRLTAVALLALLIAAVAGCGGDERDAVRERVEEYIESERQVMHRAEPDFQRANETYIAYAKGELEPDTAAERVEEAEEAIRNARDGVLVLDPPAEARNLHEDLVRYLDLNVDLARQTSRLVTYVPAAVRALAPLDRANRRLKSRLAAADDSREQARQLARFADRVGSIAARLRAVKAPRVLQTTHRDQLRRLAATRRLAERVRRALRDQDAVRVSRLLKRFRGDTPRPDARRLLASQALAVYAQRLQRLSAAGADVQREQLRLMRSLR